MPRRLTILCNNWYKELHESYITYSEDVYVFSRVIFKKFCLLFWEKFMPIFVPHELVRFYSKRMERWEETHKNLENISFWKEKMRDSFELPLYSRWRLIPWVWVSFRIDLPLRRNCALKDVAFLSSFLFSIVQLPRLFLTTFHWLALHIDLEWREKIPR